MRLQKILYPRAEICNDELMYYANNGAQYGVDGVLHFAKNSKVVFDKYFNAFSVTQWLKFTELNSVKLKLELKGEYKLTVFVHELIGKNYENSEKAYKHSKVKTTTLFEEQIMANEKTDLVYDIDLSKSGQIGFSLECKSTDGEFYGGEYFTEQEPLHRVKIGIGSCTFRREKFIKHNIRSIYSEDKDELDIGKFSEMFVVDNGRTLTEEDVCVSPNVHLIPNGNLGGSGGFARAMVAALEANKKGEELTHILLMDDDIVIDPECIKRTYSLLSYVKEEYKSAYVGGAMIKLHIPYYQHEVGARWKDCRVKSNKIYQNLHDIKYCLMSDWDVKTDYAAWWYCVIPIDVVSENNLPLPLFVKCDDIEYGLRHMKGFISMNGISVWHEAFEKKYSAVTAYYATRNNLIIAALYRDKISLKKIARELAVMIYRELVGYRYKAADLVIKGIEDFAKGAEWLMAQNPEELHKELSAYGYKMQTMEELEKEYGPIKAYKGKNLHLLKARRNNILQKITFNGLIFKSFAKAKVYIESMDIKQYFNKKQVLYYDESQNKGFITVKKFWTTAHYIMTARKLKKFILKNFERISKDYEEHRVEMTSIEMWNKHF